MCVCICQCHVILHWQYDIALFVTLRDRVTNQNKRELYHVLNQSLKILTQTWDIPYLIHSATPSHEAGPRQPNSVSLSILGPSLQVSIPFILKEFVNHTYTHSPQFSSILLSLKPLSSTHPLSLDALPNIVSPNCCLNYQSFLSQSPQEASDPSFMSLV